mgnify:FL=1
MKLQPDKFDVQSITGHGPGWISVGTGTRTEKIEGSVVLGARGERLDWPCRSFADLTAEHFAQLATLNAEIVIFGSGLRNRFPPPAWLKPLITQRIGLETMDTAAACRTYNVLASEGRHVVAALLLEPGASELTPLTPER